MILGLVPLSLRLLLFSLCFAVSLYFNFQCPISSSLRLAFSWLCLVLKSPLFFSPISHVPFKLALFVSFALKVSGTSNTHFSCRSSHIDTLSKPLSPLAGWRKKLKHQSDDHVNAWIQWERPASLQWIDTMAWYWCHQFIILFHNSSAQMQLFSKNVRMVLHFDKYARQQGHK